MRWFTKCEACKKGALFIKKRKYSTIHAGIITGQSEICSKCNKGIIKQLGNEIKR